MTPYEFSQIHPKLYHLTRPSSFAFIEQHGLLSAKALCELYNVENKDRLLSKRRAKSVELEKVGLPKAYLNDNRPLSEKALDKCLDDQITPSEWLRLLNSRIFFWVDPKRFERLAKGPAHKGQDRLVLVFDSKTLLEQHIEKAAISPINTGNTLHKPARRGYNTFARLKGLDYNLWRRARPKKSLDKIVEVSFDDGIKNANTFLIEKFLI